MGNRAVVTFSKSKTTGIGIYVHWNGGLESILAFLAICKHRAYRNAEVDVTYATARLIGVMHEFFDGGLSLGVGELRNLDCNNYDNGVYVLGKDWDIISRWGDGSEKRMALTDLDARELEQYTAIINKHKGKKGEKE
jgi:hypothetical protein